ncbi:MAG: ABC transporter ATP-binding protein [Candidatus Anammoxibacter sp.]
MKDVARTYRLGAIDVHALRTINLQIDTNEYVSIMGPSGSGKSTLMNIMGCLDAPSTGEYHLNGKNVSKLNDNQLSDIRNKKIGFVFQTFNLLSRRTALQNVELPLIYNDIPFGERKQIALDALEQVGLADRTNHKPNELSGGQCQRVAIARALVNKPSLILADEPTGNLDSKTGKEIMAIIRTLYENGNSIILVTHEQDVAEHADRIIVLSDGSIKSDKQTNTSSNQLSKINHCASHGLAEGRIAGV